jgi:hypothetical protein
VLKNLEVGENENREAGLKRENELSPPAKANEEEHAPQKILIPAK